MYGFSCLVSLAGCPERVSSQTLPLREKMARLASLAPQAEAGWAVPVLLGAPKKTKACAYKNPLA